MTITLFKAPRKYETIGIQEDIVIPILTAKKHDFLRNLQRKKHKRKIFSYFFKAHTGSLLLILGAYMTIIFVACTILVISVYRLDDLNHYDSFYINKNITNDEGISNGNEKYFDLKLSNKLFRDFIWLYKDSSKLFNCSVLNNVKKFKYLTSGWTKSVFSFDYNGKNFALKTVNLNGNDLKSCMQTNLLKTCYEKASSKMFKEYILSKELSHTNILKIYSWCVSNDSVLENVAVVTELCSPIDTVSLLQMSFQQRIHIIYDLVQLVNYLSSSSLGSIAINDFRRQQFVLCGTTLKLTDLDDLSIEEPRCRNDENCSLDNHYDYLKIPKNYSDSYKIKCVDYVCMGYNEKKNIINVYKYFINIFLTIDIPKILKYDVESFVHIYLAKENSMALLKELEFLYQKFNNTVLNLNA